MALTLDTSNAKLGGVLAGLARHFNTDATLLRIIYALLFLGLVPFIKIKASALIVLYFVAWLIMRKDY